MWITKPREIEKNVRTHKAALWSPTTASVNPKEVSDKLISDTRDGLGLQLREGECVAISGTYNHQGRDLKILYSYNRTFNKSNYPKSGSWTKSMRPDYTLSIWPAEFSAEKAERQELMVHVHFDAKYRVDGLEYLNPSQSEGENDLNEEKQQEKQGRYKRADLLKMHAYKDAIRRTVGAYVLYPGSDTYKSKSFHEITPGLGAFPISPSDNGKGLDVIRSFILEIVEHVSNRASQSEQLSYHAYNIHKSQNVKYKTNKRMPEYNKYSGDRVPPPTEITVLVGYCKSKQYVWVKEKGLYNVRLDVKGLEAIGPKEIGANYLIIRRGVDPKVDNIWRIVSPPVVMGSQELIDASYPSTPSVENYLVYKIESVDISEFDGATWDLGKLTGVGGNAYRPFTLTLSELSQASVN